MHKVPVMHATKTSMDRRTFSDWDVQRTGKQHAYTDTIHNIIILPSYRHLWSYLDVTVGVVCALPPKAKYSGGVIAPAASCMSDRLVSHHLTESYIYICLMTASKKQGNFRFGHVAIETFGVSSFCLHVHAHISLT